MGEPIEYPTSPVRVDVFDRAQVELALISSGPGKVPLEQIVMDWRSRWGYQSVFLGEHGPGSLAAA